MNPGTLERSCDRLSLGLAVSAVLLPACGADDRAAPNLADLTLAKPDTGSGDAQVGVAGAPLGQDLRVVVTRDGVPVKGVTVIWSTIEGSLLPRSATTDERGRSSARWTLQHLFAQQVAAARLDSAGPPSRAVHGDRDARSGGRQHGAGGRGRQPVRAGRDHHRRRGYRSNWLWPEGSAGHNVVPDDGDTPPQSGPLVAYPKYHSFRFEIPGVYHYHCMAHGDVGGVGMSGTVTVLPQPDR